MTLKDFASWAVAHPELALILAGTVVTAITSAYAAVKIAFQRVTGRAAKGGVWTVLDVVIELLPNAPGALNRLLRAGGAPSIFAPPARDTVAPPPSDPQRGAVRVGALLAICGAVVVASVVGAVLTGCPRPRDCTPASQRCEGDTPVICDGEGRSWRASGDPIVMCAQVGGVCLVREGRAYCGRADAGVASDGGAL